MIVGVIGKRGTTHDFAPLQTLDNKLKNNPLRNVIKTKDREVWLCAIYSSKMYTNIDNYLLQRLESIAKFTK